MKPWKRIDPTIVTKIDYPSVVVKTFAMPDGAVKTWATFLSEGRLAAGVVAVTKDKKIVVARQFRPGPEKIFDEIPGGFVDEGEEPEAAARRELLEETGYAAGEMIPLGVFSRDAYVNGEWHYFLAVDCELTSEQVLETEEFIDLRLLDIDEFIENAKQGKMTDIPAVFAAYEELLKIKEKK